MQIYRYEISKQAHFVIHRQEIGNHDGKHAGSRRRSHAIVRILQRQTRNRLNPKRFGGGKVWVWVGFAVRVVTVCDNCIEAMG